MVELVREERGVSGEQSCLFYSCQRSAVFNSLCLQLTVCVCVRVCWFRALVGQSGVAAAVITEQDVCGTE